MAAKRTTTGFTLTKGCKLCDWVLIRSDIVLVPSDPGIIEVAGNLMNDIVAETSKWVQPPNPTECHSSQIIANNLLRSQFGNCPPEFEICTMFTGIIETTGTIKEITSNGTNKTFWVRSSLSSQLKIDQSVSHSGVCLTVEEVNGNTHRVSAIAETLAKTNLSSWQPGSIVNIERCLQLNGRLDGHFVQGHVDTTGHCLRKTDKNGSWEFEISFPENFASLIIEKGSICVNGISLTAFNVTNNSFTVAIIPYTYEHTDIYTVEQGTPVNLEFDLIGKYILRKISLNT